jgi:histone H1/5
MPRAPKIKSPETARTREEAPSRASKVLAKNRISGDAPVAGIVAAKPTKKAAVKTKPTLKKTNSKGEVVKVKAKSHPPYKAMIKRSIKENQSRKGTTRQAISKYILANYGVQNAHALKRALNRGVLDKKFVAVSLGRYNLSKSEKRVKKTKKTKKAKVKKDKKTKDKKTSSKKKSSKSKKDGSTKKTKTVKKQQQKLLSFQKLSRYQ